LGDARGGCGMKVAIVTGSGKKRVGSHVVEALCQRDYAVVVHYRKSRKEALETVAKIQAAGGQAIALGADLSVEADVKALTTKVLKEYGTVDVLVNTAALWEAKVLEKVKAADVLKHFHINTLGTFLMCQHVGLAMAKQSHGGLIVNFGDWADVRPYAGYAAYFPSKCAIPGLTRTFAVELAARNPKLRVNAILPGPVMLPEDLPAAEREEAVAGTLVKREGNPGHAVKAVLSFLDNDFLTGVCLPVDGGRSIYANGY
jgi:pteridine reductase